jgi:hypothetical protein
MDCGGGHVDYDTEDMHNPVGRDAGAVCMVQFCSSQEHNANPDRCLTIPFGIVIQCSFVFQTDAQTCQPFQCEITVLHLSTVQYRMSQVVGAMRVGAMQTILQTMPFGV